MTSQIPGRFSIDVVHSWTTHLGAPDRQSARSIEEQHQIATEAVRFSEVMTEFAAAAKNLGAECDWTSSSHEDDSRHYFDMGIDTVHLVQVVAACAGAVPLTVLIKSTRDILVKLIAKSGVEVELGDGRKIRVRTVGELEKTLALLENAAAAAPDARAKPKDSKAPKKTGKGKKRT